MKGGYRGIFRIVGMLFFNVILNLIISNMKRGYSGAWGYG